MQLLDLGSALAGLCWPVMGAQTVWLRGSRLRACFWPPGKEVTTCPGCTYGPGLNSQAILAVQTDRFLWLKFNGHNAFPFS